MIQYPDVVYVIIHKPITPRPDVMFQSCAPSEDWQLYTFCYDLTTQQNGTGECDTAKYRNFRPEVPSFIGLVGPKCMRKSSGGPRLTRLLFANLHKTESGSYEVKVN